MPISRDEWNKGRTEDTLESVVESFLRTNSGKAYAMSEIVDGLFTLKYQGLGDWLTAFASFYGVSRALESLLKEGRIKSRVVKQTYGAETFYMAEPRG